MDEPTLPLAIDSSQDAVIEAERILNEEVRRLGLEFAELSVTMRELLGKVYIRGGIEVIKKLKKSSPHLPLDL